MRDDRSASPNRIGPSTGRLAARAHRSARTATAPPASQAGHEERHTHKIHVETGPEPVFVSIGQAGQQEAQDDPGRSQPTVPGGFAKLFNRVIDSGAWARLPEAGRAVYVPLVRFAEAREGFRVRIGLAGLMRHTGLSRSSVKRGLKALQEHHLLVLVRAGGVTPNGKSTTNAYQLLVPDEDEEWMKEGDAPQTAARAKRGGRSRDPIVDSGCGDEVEAQPSPPRVPDTSSARPERFVGHAESFPGLSGGGSPADPLRVHCRTPWEFAREPLAGSYLDPAGGPREAGSGVTDGPLQRTYPRKQHSAAAAASQVNADAAGAPPSAASMDAARRLVAIGVQQGIAHELVEVYSPSEIDSAITRARQANAVRRLRNPAGFVIRCLEEQWIEGDAACIAGTATAVPACRPEGSMPNAAVRQQAEQAMAQRALEDAAIDALDEETLQALAARVLAMHQDRPAMLRLLTAKPARQSRLMRAEIAALVKESEGGR